MPGDLGFQLGRFLVILGVIIIVAGLILMLGTKFPTLGFGKLPGDIVYRSKHGSFYFPIVTCVLLSVVLTFILWLISFLTRR